MTRNPIAWLIMGALLWPGAAGANWQYTKWGMTPEQVQKAAKGKLSPVTGPADACPACTTMPLLAGDFDVAGQVFRARFEFSGQSLAKVVLAMQARRQSWGRPPDQIDGARHGHGDLERANAAFDERGDDVAELRRVGDADDGDDPRSFESCRDAASCW